MFTGIVENAGTVKDVARRGEDALLVISTSMGLDDVRVGDSIAVSGACLTVVSVAKDSFSADVSAETLAKTTLKALRVGDKVNLEKALTLNTPMGGHFVLGHVDCVGEVRERKERSNSIIFGVEVGEETGRYIVQKGSIAVDGISLTVNQYENKRFYVNIIPHTARETTLGFKKAGDRVNVETDILGKYVERFVHPDSGINEDFLSKHGFLK
ncbi:MAG: riboflavin synthase [Syntrophobacterales bacterium]|nr:MAG: riboflavin synthase [Syntrophobacterales bacterium]